MTFSVTILGSNSSLPAHGRHPTAQLINHHEHFFLFDCGEGTQMRFNDLKIKRSKINNIFISHYHGDHYYGLIGLLTSYHLLRREEPIHLFAPQGIKEILEVNFKYSDTRLYFPLIIHDIDCSANEVIYENEELTISTIPMKHRIPCCGFLLKEKSASRKLLADKVEQLHIPVNMISDLKAGKDIQFGGKTIRSEDVTSAPKTPRTYAFCSDTMYHEEIIPIVYGVDLLYHEATFMNDSAERAALTFHSTTLQAATIAKKAAVKKLLIGHFSAKYIELEPMLAEAQTIFMNTELAIEGKTYELKQQGIPSAAS